MFTIRIQGLSEAITYVDKVERGLANLGPLMARIAAVIEGNVHKRFDQQVDPDGNPWDAWSASTAEQRSREGISSILNHTGALLASLSAAASGNSAFIEFDAPYAVFLEEGTEHMPARHLLFSTDGELGAMDTQSVTDELESYINELID